MNFGALAAVLAATAALATVIPSGLGAAGVARYLDPAWSPDGRKIAFVQMAPYPQSKSAIYVVNSNGTGLRRLTAALQGAGPPTWSPDGRKIAFSESRGLYVMNANGSGLHHIAFERGLANADWGPGGRKIAYEVPGETTLDPTRIFLISPDGSQVEVAADPVATPADDSFTAPTWSPDGQRLLFAVAKINDAGFEPIKSFFGVIEGPAGPLRDLLRGDYSWYPNYSQGPLDGRGWDPDWSPDGRRIVFTANNAVAILDLRTHRLQQLRADSYRPRWSPDGKRIVYVSGPVPPNQIYIMNADGSNPRQLVP